MAEERDFILSDDDIVSFASKIRKSIFSWRKSDIIETSTFVCRSDVILSKNILDGILLVVALEKIVLNIFSFGIEIKSNFLNNETGTYGIFYS